MHAVHLRRSATAIWVGDLKEGKGYFVRSQKGTLSPSGYVKIGDTKGGTQPFDLIAAAHAACFCMKLASELTDRGFVPHRVTTRATITSKNASRGWTITGIELDVLAEVPGAEQADFITAAISAKTTCVICRLFNTNVSMSAKLQRTGDRH